MSKTLDNGHWHREDHMQRMTDAEWKAILLAYGDTITRAGHVRKLHGKKIGFGVVEVTKMPLDTESDK